MTDEARINWCNSARHPNHEHFMVQTKQFNVIEMTACIATRMLLNTQLSEFYNQLYLISANHKYLLDLMAEFSVGSSTQLVYKCINVWHVLIVSNKARAVFTQCGGTWWGE